MQVRSVFQGRLVDPRGANMMINIATFAANDKGFTDTLHTLTQNVKVKFVPNDKGNENVPNYHIQAERPYQSRQPFVLGHYLRLSH